MGTLVVRSPTESQVAMSDSSGKAPEPTPADDAPTAPVPLAKVPVDPTAAGPAPVPYDQPDAPPPAAPAPVVPPVPPVGPVPPAYPGYNQPPPYAPPPAYGAVPSYGQYAPPGESPAAEEPVAPEVPPGAVPPGYPPFHPPRLDGVAVGSIIMSSLGIPLLYCCGVGIPMCIAGIVMGFVARKRVHESGGRLTGEGMALAGIIVGAVGLALITLWAVSILVTPDRNF
jgi:hypothetical protein